MSLVQKNEIDNVKKNLEENSKNVELYVEEEEEDQNVQGLSEEELKRKKKQKLKKTLGVVGTTAFFGICLVTPPFGWVAAAGAVTGALTGAVVGKGVEKIEKTISKRKMSIKKKKTDEEEDVY